MTLLSKLSYRPCAGIGLNPSIPEIDPGSGLRLTGMTMIVRTGFLCLLLSVLVLPFREARALEPAEFPLLATIAPWTYAAKPVGYRGRIWFANANRWPDHNSADIWSVRPDGTDLRLERRLFSQDVGEPVVHQGLLYWPFEDPRVSLGWGQIAVTNGEDWRVLETRVGRQFHLHGLISRENDLLAAGSAWSAQILTSTDLGRTWAMLYEAERMENRYSRTYQLVSAADGLYGDLIEFGGAPRSFAMLRHNKDGVEPVAGWPATEGLVRRALHADGGALVLMGAGKSQRLVHLKDGAFDDQPLPDGVIAIDMAGPDPLWLLGKQEPKRHQLWRRTETGWRLTHRFAADEAVELRLVGGAPVVAGTHDRLARVWGQPGPIARSETPTLPTQISDGPVDEAEARRQIEGALADPQSYVGHGVRLRNVVDHWVTLGLGGEVLSGYLNGSFPEGEVKLLGGRATASHERFGRWILTWGMRRAGSGTVPRAWLRAPFQEPVNDSAKYFSEPVAAAWTAAATGQNDWPTKSAMLERAIDRDQPEWLRIDYETNIKILDRP